MISSAGSVCCHVNVKFDLMVGPHVTGRKHVKETVSDLRAAGNAAGGVAGSSQSAGGT